MTFLDEFDIFGKSSIFGTRKRTPITITKFIREDKRETPIATKKIQALYAENKIMYYNSDLEDRELGNIWMEIPGVSIGFTLKIAQDVVILASANPYFIVDNGTDPEGFEIRISINGTVKANSQRNTILDADFVGAGHVAVDTTVNQEHQMLVDLNYVENLTAGNYVVTLQGFFKADTTVDAEDLKLDAGRISLIVMTL